MRPASLWHQPETCRHAASVQLRMFFAVLANIYLGRFVLPWAVFMDAKINNTTKGQPAVSKREATNPSGQDRHLEACNDAICSQLPIRPGLASRSESAGADERGNSPTEGKRTTIVTRISGGAQETYSHHPKSRIPRNSCEIRNMNFPTRNTLPCFASQSMGGSFSPLCVPASSPSSLRFSPGRRGG